MMPNADFRPSFKALVFPNQLTESRRRPSTGAGFPSLGAHTAMAQRANILLVGGVLALALVGIAVAGPVPPRRRR